MDRPRDSKEPGAVPKVLDIITDHPCRGARPSARLADCSCVPRAGGAGLTTCKSSRHDSFFSKLKRTPSLSLSLALSQERTPLLGTLIRALLGPSEHIPRLSARFSTMSSGYFFSNNSLSLLDFEQEGD
jgi:hypothetical protein